MCVCDTLDGATRPYQGFFDAASPTLSQTLLRMAREVERFWTRINLLCQKKENYQLILNIKKFTLRNSLK